MIIHPAEQGSAAWVEARLGIPTSSQFSRILTPGGKLSKSRDDYIAELVAEWALGEQFSEFAGTEWTERGHILEGQARAAYGLLRDADVTEVGTCYIDDWRIPTGIARMVASSPDGLVGSDGCLELKCPKAGTHLLWLARGVIPREHVLQVQGQIWVTGRSWSDFMSYHPGLPPFLVRSEPDDKLQAAMDQHIPTFIEELLAGRERLRELGVEPALQEVA